MLLVLILFVYILIVLVIGWFMHFSFRGIVTKTPSKSELSEYKVEDVTLVAPEGNRLACWFVKSPINEENKTLVFVHGWNHTRATLLPHIKLMVDAGYHVFAFDQRSHGASTTARLTFGPRESKDFKAVIDYLLTRNDVNPERIGAFSESIGGSTVVHAIAYFADVKSHIKAVLIEGTWARTTDIMLYVLESRYGFSRLAAYIFGYLVIWPGVRFWGLGRLNHSYPIELVENVSPIPMFFIRGQNDYMVPEYSAMDMINRAKEPKQIWILPDSLHRKAYQTHPEEFKKRVLEFYGTYV